MTPLPGRRPAERCGTVRMLSDGSRDRQAPSTKVSETTSCMASTGIADVGRRRRQMKAAVHTPADATAGGTIAGRAALVRAGPREKNSACSTHLWSTAGRERCHYGLDANCNVNHCKFMQLPVACNTYASKQHTRTDHCSKCKAATVHRSCRSNRLNWIHAKITGLSYRRRHVGRAGSCGSCGLEHGATDDRC